MPGKSYSAGRIFLQVVPSFKNLQRDIGDQVKRANRGVEKEHEEAGKRAAEARDRGESKVRQRSSEQELSDYEKLQARKLAAFQRYSQMVVGERVKERARINKEEAVTERERQRLSKKNLALQIADEAAAAKAKREQAARNAKYASDLQKAILAGDIKARREAEAQKAREDEAAAKEERARAARNAKAASDLQRQIWENDRKTREKARADEARAEEAASRAAEARERRDESRRAVIRRRRATERLNDLRALDAERRRLAGGDAGRKIRDASKGAADAIGVFRIEADSSPAKREMAALRERLVQLSDTEIGVDLNANDALAELETIRARIALLDKKHPEIRVEANTTIALAKLKRLEEQIDQINHKKASSGFMSLFTGAAGGADQGANSFRIFNFRILGLLLLLPTLAPLLASTAGAIGAIGTAAIGGAAGLGVMIAGFTGLGDAITAMGEVRDNKAKDALQSSKTIRTALKSLRDAEQGVAKAREQGARAAEDAARRVADAQRNVGDVEARVARNIKSALRAQEDAERSLARAQKDATKAQEDLAAARKQAQQDQQDLADKIASGKLDERQALIDLFNAQVAYNAVMADGASTNLDKESASIALERAQLAIKGIRKENAQLEADQKKGVAGNENVARAQERVTETAQGVKDAQQAVVDADENTRQARIDGARDIADAQQSVTDALTNQAQVAQDNATAQRDAAERLGDAQAAYQEALTKTGDIGSSAMDKLNTAMGKLSPAGREFATFIFGLLGNFQDLRNLIQEGMLPPLQKEMQLLIDTYGPSFKDFIKTMAGAVGDFFTSFGTALRSPEMRSFFETMAKYAPTFFTQFGGLFINIMKIIAGIAKAFAPFAKDFMDGLVSMTGEWAKWADGLDKNQGFKDFIDYVKREGPKVWQLIKDIAIVLIHIGKGLSENGSFDMLVGFFDYLATVDPGTIAAIATAIAGFAIASQVAAGVNALATTIGFLVTSSIGIWILAIVAIVGAIVWLYNNNEDFRKGVDAIWAWIQKAVKAVGDWWTNTFVPNFTAGIKAIGDFFSGLWETVRPIFKDIWGGFEQMAGYIKGAWDTVLKPLFDIIGKVLTGDFVGAWDAAVKMVGTIWDKLTELFRTPINFVINTILNDGLFKAINAVLRFLGVSADHLIPMIMPITTPAPAGSGFAGSKKKNKYAFAEGGVMPGYSPGRDIHTFYSPTGGRLDLSGGEGIMRPEFTRMVGGEAGINYLNAEARKGRLPWQRFAIGGMVKPVNAAPGASWGHYPSGRVHRALDFPVRVGTPVVMPYPAQVIRDGWDNTGFGTHVRAQFFGAGNGTFGIFGHLLREIVSVGQRLEAGDVLGYSGNSGNSTGPHLHFEMRTSPYDPKTSFDYTSALTGGRVVTPAAGAAGADLPWWADKPLEYLRGVVNDGLNLIPVHGIFGDLLRGIPNKIFDGARDFIGNLLGGNSGQMAEDAATGGKFVWNGREVPNNGTQMFDNGGKLQPGVTQVLNMTGRPEPVFTADQYARGTAPTAAGPLVGTYSPTFNDSGVTAGEVIGELDYYIKRVSHGGKFAGRAH